MSLIYEEILDGESIIRSAPGSRHEQICSRLHAKVSEKLPAHSPAKILTPRSIIQLSAGVMLRPDLALVAAVTGKIVLAAEIVDSHDHQPDTVTKKIIYEDHGIPRLWMIDPRYNNVEIYHGTPYGLALKGILAGKQCLREPLLPDFVLTIDELFEGLI